MKGFPDGVCREDANVLHRLDQQNSQIMLLIQSDITPNWAAFDQTLLLQPDPFDPQPNPAVRSLASLDLQNGRILTFRLRANPTIKKVRRDENGNRLNSNRVPLVHEDKQLAWLEVKAEQSGFRLLEANITPEGKQNDYHKKLTIYTILVNGRLQITDSEKFNTALRQGIGPAKAFGCGLLSLAPG
jgi:CRISPR system Cascade subunit CasE